MTASLLEALDGFLPRLLLTLGSGLGELAEEVTDARTWRFEELALPASTVPGHAGRLLAGSLHGVPVLVQQGRLHLYEGVTAAEVAAVVRAAAEAGVEALVATNAAGGLAPDLVAGDLMVITDHLNLTGDTPLRGPAFIDMGRAYAGDMAAALQAAGEEVGTPMQQGVYAGLRGPAYETPAEVRMLRTMGADAVGMSTVLEVLAAREAGLPVAGVSLITNVHGPGGTPTSHTEVLDAAASGGPRLAAVLRVALPRLLDAPGPPPGR